MDLGTSKATIIAVGFLLTRMKNATRNESLKKGNGRMAFRPKNRIQGSNAFDENTSMQMRM